MNYVSEKLKKLFKKKEKFNYDLSHIIYDMFNTFNIHTYEYNSKDVDTIYLIFNKFFYKITIFDDFIVIIPYINNYNITDIKSHDFYNSISTEPNKYDLNKLYINRNDDNLVVSEIKKYFKNEIRISKIKKII